MSKNSRGADRIWFLTVFFLLLIVADCSSAYSIWSVRKLISTQPNDNSTATNISPLPSPESSGNESKASPLDSGKSTKEKPKDPQPLNDSGKVNPKGSDNNNNNSTAAATRPTDKQIDNGKNHEGKEKIKDNTKSQSANNGSCEGSTKSCRVPKTMVACIQNLESGSKGLVLLVQNEGENPLNVNVIVPASLKNYMNGSAIPQNQTERINLSLSIGQYTEIVLKAGKEECVLHLGSSQGNFLRWLPSYYKQVTPIYVAYFLFLIALIVGGTWTCCKFRKRRRQEGVPYQELEMGLPETAATTNIDVTEVWDEGWDDDWDEDNAVKSPGGNHIGSISANGLTARSANRDGWEKDWDD